MAKPTSGGGVYTGLAAGKICGEVAARAVGGEAVEVWADAGCNDLFGNLPQDGTVAQAAIATCDDEIRQLYYDYEVLLDYAKCLPDDAPRR